MLDISFLFSQQSPRDKEESDGESEECNLIRYKVGMFGAEDAHEDVGIFPIVGSHSVADDQLHEPDEADEE